MGASPAIDAAAFALPVGGVSDPIVTDNGAVVVKVLEKTGRDARRLVAGKERRGQIRTELLNERRNRFYASYMGKARERMKVNINHEVHRAAGGVALTLRGQPQPSSRQPSRIWSGACGADS